MFWGIQTPELHAVIKKNEDQLYRLIFTKWESKWQDCSDGTSPQRVYLWAALNLEKPVRDPEPQGWWDGEGGMELRTSGSGTWGWGRAVCFVLFFN